MTVSPVLDSAGRQRSPATLPGCHADARRATRDLRYPADPPTVEEIIAVMRQTSDDRHDFRLRALIIVLWRGGLRIQEALELGERDLDPRRGSCSCATARAAGAGRSAWKLGVGSSFDRGWSPGSSCRSGRCSASATVRPAGGRGRAPMCASSFAGLPLTRVSGAVCAAPAAPRPRGRARSRGGAAQRDPAPARPREPRHDQHLPAGHRHGRDHRHSPRPARANDVRHHRPATLSFPKAAAAGAPTAPAARSSRSPLRGAMRSSQGTRPRRPSAPGPRPGRQRLWCRAALLQSRGEGGASRPRAESAVVGRRVCR